jgi:predicted transcriptional regulator
MLRRESSLVLASVDARFGKRTIHEIVAQILDVCHDSVGKTTLMYRCNMSYGQLMRYLNLMLDAKLLHIDNNHRHPLFKISDKGRYFLEAFKSLRTLIED